MQVRDDFPKKSLVLLPHHGMLPVYEAFVVEIFVVITSKLFSQSICLLSCGESTLEHMVRGSCLYPVSCASLRQLVVIMMVITVLCLLLE